MKKITIEIDSKTDLLPYTALCEFQGDLKTLTKENFEKLRKQILEQGFSYAIHVWFSAKDNKNYILDGHQRLRVIKYLVETEKYECPPLPVVFVRATNFKAARKKLLAGASQYGNVESQGLYKILSDSGFSETEFDNDFSFPELDPDQFKAEFYNGPDADAAPELKNEDKKLQALTFILSNDQVDQVRAAMATAKELGPLEDEVNQNSNGNALARVCELFLGTHG